MKYAQDVENAFLRPFECSRRSLRGQSFAAPIIGARMPVMRRTMPLMRCDWSYCGRRVFVALVMGVSAVIAAPALAQDIATELRAALKLDARDATVVGAHVIELPGGREVFSLNAELPFTPASNMKLVTTAAALELLGRDFEFRTIGSLRGEDLLVIGGGDPLLAHPRAARPAKTDLFSVFYEWADALLAAGVGEIHGDLIVDDSVFDRQWTHPSWPADQLDKHYCAPVGGLNLHGNCIEAVVYPGRNGSGFADYMLVPTNPWVRVDNRCRISGTGRPWMIRKGGGLDYILSGRCAEQTTVGLVTVDDPGMFFGTTLRTYLAAKGIRVSGRVRRGATSGTSLFRAERPAFIHATPLAEVLIEANTHSLNLAAECLLKMLGRHGWRTANGQARPGSWDSGQAAIASYLERIGLDTSEAVIADGSGLSRANIMTPSALTALLAHVFAGADRELFMGSLARSGINGTLRKRMRDIPGRFLGKTGYIDGVRTLSGYLRTDEGAWLALSIMHNGFVGPSAKYRDAQDRVCRILTTYDVPATLSGTR